MGTGTPAYAPLSNEEDPLFGSIDGTLTDPVVGLLEAIGVSRNGGGRGRSGKLKCLCLRDLPLSALHSFGQGRSSETPASMVLPHLSPWNRSLLVD